MDPDKDTNPEFFQHLGKEWFGLRRCRGIPTFQTYFSASRKSQDVFAALVYVFVVLIALLPRVFTLHAPSCSDSSSSTVNIVRQLSRGFQASWAAPGLPLQMLHSVAQQTILGIALYCTVPVCIIALALNQPQWYLNGGRNTVLFAARSVARVAVLVTLQLGSARELAAGDLAASAQAGMTGVFGLLFWSIVFPVPLPAFLSSAPLEIFLSIAVNFMLNPLPHPLPSPLRHHLLPTILHPIAGLLLALAFHSFHTRHSLARYSHLISQLPPTPNPATRPAPTRTHNTKSTQPSPSLPNPTPATQPAPDATPSFTQPPCPPPPTPLPRRRLPYISATKTRIISAKVHHHDAYPMRKAIIAAFQTELTATATAAVTVRLALDPSSAKTQPAPPVHPPFILSSAAFKGCLHLILDLTHLPSSAGPLLSTPEAVDQLLGRLHATLPTFCCTAPVTFHVTGMDGGDLFVEFPPMVPGDLASVSLPRFQAAAKKPGMAAAQHSCCVMQSGRVVLEPPVLEAGSRLQQTLMVGHGGLGEGCEGGAEVVVVGWEGGRAEGRVVLRRELEEGWAAHDLSLLLPPDLPPGPASIYLLSTRPGLQGALLASTTTLCLPHPTTQELLHLHATLTNNPTSPPSTLPHILDDLAATWKLLHAATPHPTAMHPAFRQCLSTTNLPTTLHFIHELAMPTRHAVLGPRIASCLSEPITPAVSPLTITHLLSLLPTQAPSLPVSTTTYSCSLLSF